MTMKNSTVIKIILLLLICLTNSFRVQCKPLNETQLSITQMMLNSNCICDPVKLFINQSELMKECKYIENSQKKLHLSPGNIKTLLCYGIYDSFCNICHLGTLNAVNIPLTPVSKVEEQVKSRIQRNDTMKQFCQYFAQNISATDNSVQQYVKLLHDELSNLKSCLLMCSDDNGEPNKLCQLLHWLYEVITTSSNTSTIIGLHVKPTSKKYNPHNKTSSEVQNFIATTIKKNKSNPTVQITNSNVANYTSVQPESGKVNRDHILPNVSSIQQKEKKIGDEIPTSDKPSKNIQEPEKKSMVQESLNSPNNEDTSKTNINIEMNHILKSNVDQDIISNNNQNYKSNINEISQSVVTEPETTTKETSLKANEIGPLSENTDDHMNAPNLDDSIQKDDFDDIDLPNDPEKNMESVFDQDKPVHIYHKAELEDGSHMFLYFTLTSLCCIILYIVYLGKQKILATLAKIRRSRNRGRRRPSTANYRKLDCTLEEAMTSQCDANVTHVIY